MEGCILLAGTIACIVVFWAIASYPKVGEEDAKESDRV